MGLSGEVKKKILEGDEKTKNIWQKDVPPNTGGALIVDSLPDLRILRNEQDYKNIHDFTGEELFNAYYKRFQKGFMDGYTVVVSMFDDNERVPSQKAGEQKSRSENNSNAPYPADSRFVSSGIVFTERGRPIERINRDRLCASRSARRALCEWFLECIKTKRNTRIPPGGTFVLDFDSNGPWVITPESATQVTALRHPFGEADMMVPFWCRVLRGMDVFVRTIDSDIFLILLNYCARCGNQSKNIYYHWEWKRPLRRLKKGEVLDEDEEDDQKIDGKGTVLGKRKLMHTKPAKEGDVLRVKEPLPGYIDMKKMTAAIGDRLWPFTIACVLCGTDFHHKKLLVAPAARIGDAFILDWGLDPKNSYRSTKGWDLTALVEGRANVWPWAFSSPIFMAAWYQKRGGHTSSREESKREQFVAPVIAQPDLFDLFDELDDLFTDEKKKVETGPKTVSEHLKSRRLEIAEAEAKRLSVVADQSRTSPIAKRFLAMLTDLHRYAEKRKNSKTEKAVGLTPEGRASAAWTLQYWTADFRLISARLPVA